MNFEIPIEQGDLRAPNLFGVERHDALEALAGKVSPERSHERFAQPMEIDGPGNIADDLAVNFHVLCLGHSVPSQPRHGQQDDHPAGLLNQTGLIDDAVDQGLLVGNAFQMVRPGPGDKPRRKIQPPALADQPLRRLPTQEEPLGRVHGFGDSETQIGNRAAEP